MKLVVCMVFTPFPGPVRSAGLKHEIKFESDSPEGQSRFRSSRRAGPEMQDFVEVCVSLFPFFVCSHLVGQVLDDINHVRIHVRDAFGIVLISLQAMLQQLSRGFDGAKAHVRYGRERILREAADDLLSMADEA